MTESSDIPYLIKLLDDDSDATKSALSVEFKKYEGDISDDIAAHGIDLSPADRHRLNLFLHPGRREKLSNEWAIPTNLNYDWDSFEHLLRLISDFLHDGISLRPSIHDSLDILAEEVDRKIHNLTANRLRNYLFCTNRFCGARVNYYALQNSDLNYTLETGKGNPITLALLFQLVAQRLHLEVSSSNYPGHFLSRIHLSSTPHLVDCYNMGNLIPVDELLQKNKHISAEAKYAIHTEASPKVILHRILRNLERSFTLSKATEDALLMQKLQGTVVS